MSAAAAPPTSGFSPRVILTLVVVAIVAFAGLAVLFAYADDLRGHEDTGAHALSSSAVGFKGALVMLRAQGVTATASRTRPPSHPGQADGALLVLTPGVPNDAKDLEAFTGARRRLIVLPKWMVSPDPNPLRRGFVTKDGAVETTADATALLKALAPQTEIARRKGVTRPLLHNAAAAARDLPTYPRVGPIDQLQTLSGAGWIPILVDEEGRMVLAASRRHPKVMVLAEPDLLNNHGLANLDTARVGMSVLNGLRGDGGVRFDVTLLGYSRGRGLLRLMLEPPWLAATLCAVAAAALMGLHSLVRFGPAQRRGRALALGAGALIDNSAGLVRAARREAEFAEAYLAVVLARTVRGARGSRHEAADAVVAGELARQRGVASPDAFEAEAGRVRTRDDLLAFGAKLHQWGQEIAHGRK